jgi:hypothetical protein
METVVIRRVRAIDFPLTAIDALTDTRTAAGSADGRTKNNAGF